MGLLTNDPQTKKVFGQNITACLALTGKDMNWLVSETKLGKRLLGDIQAGTGHVTIDIVDTISKVFNLELLDIVKSHGPAERRYEQLRALLEDAGNRTLPEVKAPIIVTGPTVSIQRVEALSRPVPVIVMEPPAPSPESVKVAVIESLVKNLPSFDSVITTEPKAHVAIEVMSQKASTNDTPPQSESEPDESEIVWHRSGLLATIDSVTYDFTNKELRKLIASRIRYVKGPLSFHALTSKMRPQKQSSWPGVLEKGSGQLSKKELLQVAQICNVDVRSLITGHGITGLMANQSPHEWLETYTSVQSDGSQLKQTAQELIVLLKKWPTPTQVMLVSFLDEAIE